jgi:hypothetical protein
MLRYLPAVLGIAAVVHLTACEDETRVRVRQPQAQYVIAAPVQEVVVAQPQVVVAEPRVTEVVTVAEPRVEEVIVQEGPPVAHLRMAPAVMYGGRRVYWYGNRWYYQNGGRWAYYGSEPVGLRGRRYVVAP